jgi:hypothetical protein
VIYSVLRQQILTWTSNTDNDFAQQINTFIQQAEAKIGMLKKLPNYQATVTLNLSATSNVVPAPAGYISADFISVDGYGIIEKKDPAFLVEAFPDSIETGPPRFWAQKDDKNFVFGPFPDKAYVMTLQFFSKWPSLVDLGLSPTTQNQQTFISNYFEPALLNGSLYYANLYMKDAEMAQLHKIEMQEDLGLVTKFGNGRAKRQEAEKTTSSIDSGDID